MYVQKTLIPISSKKVRSCGPIFDFKVYVFQTPDTFNLNFFLNRFFSLGYFYYPWCFEVWNTCEDRQGRSSKMFTKNLNFRAQKFQKTQKVVLKFQSREKKTFFEKIGLSQNILSFWVFKVCLEVFVLFWWASGWDIFMKVFFLANSSAAFLFCFEKSILDNNGGCHDKGKSLLFFFFLNVLTILRLNSLNASSN